MMNKRLWALPVLAALLLAAGGGVGFAMPSLGGPTGIVSVPTAEIAPPNTLQTALSYQAFKVKEIEAAGMYAPATTRNEDFTAWSLQGLAGITDMAELWAAYTAVRNENDSHVWGIGGKFAFTKEPEDTAALAIGASYQEWVDGLEIATTSMYGGVPETITTDAKVLKAYLVATKDFTPMKSEKWEWGPGAGTRMLGTVGLLYLRADPGVGEAETLTRPFIGFEFLGAGGTSIGLEYRWQDDNLDEKAVFSAAVQHRFSDQVSVEIGTTNADSLGIGTGDQDFFARVGYSFKMKGVY